MIESATDVPALFFAGFFIVYSIAALITPARTGTGRAGARDNIRESRNDDDDDDGLPALLRRQAD